MAIIIMTTIIKLTTAALIITTTTVIKVIKIIKRSGPQQINQSHTQTQNTTNI